MIAHEIIKITEIASHEHETAVIRHVALRVGVLVKTIQTTTLTKMAQNATGMPSATKSDVYIYAFRADRQPFQTLTQHDRDMITTFLILFHQPTS